MQSARVCIGAGPCKEPACFWQQKMILVEKLNAGLHLWEESLTLFPKSNIHFWKSSIQCPYNTFRPLFLDGQTQVLAQDCLYKPVYSQFACLGRTADKGV